MTFSFFLSIYSRCGAPGSWAARHTTVCLDVEQTKLALYLYYKELISIIDGLFSVKE